MATGIEAFEGAALLLPSTLRTQVFGLGRDERLAAEEFRLRRGRRLSVLLPDGERELGGGAITAHDLDALMELATGASVHSAAESFRQGFFTAAGGHRIGLCGQAVCVNGELCGFRELSSAVIRIAHEACGAADGIFPALFPSSRPRSVLIISPPGGGKTTLMRELIRRLSNLGVRISLSDERGEIAALVGGAPQLDVGSHTDIISGAPKAEALLLMLRTMNPQMIALDEITTPADTAALVSAANCGTKLLATVHADDLSELSRRPVGRGLLRQKLFDCAVVIRTEGGVRIYRTEELKC